jgi:nucleoside-diphosphate-sugar epimerase
LAVSYRIAITGASGFVGQHLTREATRRGIDAVGVVRSELGARFVAAAGGRAVIVPGLDPAPLARAAAGAAALVHLAQIGAERGDATYESVNITGTCKAVMAAAAVEVPRLVLFSGLGVAHYGMVPRCTNRYFQSKLASEVELYRSGCDGVVFRPSYITGPGDGLVRGLLRNMAKGEVERPGDGSYRMQPVPVRDAVAAILAAVESPPAGPDFPRPRHRVFDLVGPETVTYQQLLERVGRIAGAEGKVGEYRVREVPIEEADRLAAHGGFHGHLPDDLDCLLCDEVSDPRPLEGLLGRPLTPLDEALAEAIRAA